MYQPRLIEKEINLALENNPVVAIVGPRQCGKSTLAQHILKQFPDSLYLDLERPSSYSKLNDAELYLIHHKNKIICLDEIQRKPELFPLIRSLVDEWGQNGKFIILGSASRDLLKQSSETLAGRIAYKRLTPFIWDEIKFKFNLTHYIERGGFPKSILPDNIQTSTNWRDDFISTFLERDLMQWMQFNPVLMHRLWQMLAHLNGQVVNYSAISNSLGISSVTVKNYIDLLEATFMIDILPQYYSNMGKRLVKSPRIYISDSGITSSLLGLQSYDQIFSHPSFGAVWEQIVLTNLKAIYPKANFFYYRTHAGAEIDIVMEYQNKKMVFECKATLSPSISKGSYLAIEDIKPYKSFIVSPVEEGWQFNQLFTVINLSDLVNCLHD